MGSATAASTRNFHRQREDVSQYAMGIPMTNRIEETMVASLTLNHKASQFISMGLRGQAEAVALQQGSDLRGAHEFQELSRRFLLFGVGQHDGCLVQRWVGVEGNGPIAAFRLHRWCERMRQSDQSRLRIARLHELRCLRYVFSQHQLA